MTEEAAEATVVRRVGCENVADAYEVGLVVVVVLVELGEAFGRGIMVAVDSFDGV